MRREYIQYKLIKVAERRRMLHELIQAGINYLRGGVNTTINKDVYPPVRIRRFRGVRND